MTAKNMNFQSEIVAICHLYEILTVIIRRNHSKL